MRRHDWSGFAALGAAVMILVELALGNWAWALGWFVTLLVTAGLTRYWSITYPGPMPHLLRWTLLVPRGNHSPAHLQRILEPRRGERVGWIIGRRCAIRLRIATPLARVYSFLLLLLLLLLITRARDFREGIPEGFRVGFP